MEFRGLARSDDIDRVRLIQRGPTQDCRKPRSRSGVSQTPPHEQKGKTKRLKKLIEKEKENLTKLIGCIKTLSNGKNEKVEVVYCKCLFSNRIHKFKSCHITFSK